MAAPTLHSALHAEIRMRQDLRQDKRDMVSALGQEIKDETLLIDALQALEQTGQIHRLGWMIECVNTGTEWPQ